MSERAASSGGDIVFAPREGFKYLPTIAVLASEPPGVDGYFIEGTCADVARALASFSDLVVLGVSSPLPWRRPGFTVPQAGFVHSLDYLLELEAGRSGQHLTFRLRLSDVRSRESIIDQSITQTIDALFDMQRDVIARVVGSVLPHLRQSELAKVLSKPAVDLTAYDLTLKARSAVRVLERESLAEAKLWLDQAMQLDGRYAMAKGLAARVGALHVGQSWSDQPQRDALKAVRLADAAVELDPTCSLTLANAGHAKSYLAGDHEAAIALFERAIRICPSNAVAWVLSSVPLTYLGRSEEACRNAEHAIELSPFDGALAYFHSFAGLARYGAEDYEAAVRWSRLSISANPNYATTYRCLAASLVGLGRVAEAREVAAALRAIEPALPRTQGVVIPIRDPSLARRVMTQLRTAGIQASPYRDRDSDRGPAGC